MRALHHSRSARMLCGVATLASLAACSTMRSIGIGGGTSPNQQASEVSASVRSDADIMGVLHMSNVQEISAGNLAQQRAQDVEVRNFGALMVRDHSNLDQQGSNMAQQLGVTPTTPSVANSVLSSSAQAEMDMLNRASNGSDFDRAYVQSQVTDHQRTLAIVDASISGAQRAELRTMLRDRVRPAVASHLLMAQNLQGRIGRP
jgi:putative membrane protein